jgi:hypothetical protein
MVSTRAHRRIVDPLFDTLIGEGWKHPYYTSQKVFLPKATTLGDLVGIEASGVHKVCVSPLHLSFMKNVEKTDGVVWWREVKKTDTGSVRDLVMIITEEDMAEPITQYLENSKRMETGSPDFERPIIRAHCRFTKDLGGSKQYNIAFMIVDKSSKTNGKRVTDFVRKEGHHRIPGVEIDLQGEEKFMILSSPGEKIERLERSLDEELNDVDPIHRQRYQGEDLAKSLHQYSKLELLLDWLTSYYVARQWESYLAPAMSTYEEKGCLADFVKRFPDKYVDWWITGNNPFEAGGIEHIMAKQVEKTLKGEDIPLLFRPSQL